MKLLQMMMRVSAIVFYDWLHRKAENASQRVQSPEHHNCSCVVQRTWPHRYYRTRREIEGQSDQTVNWRWSTIQDKTTQIWPEGKNR